MQNKSKVYLKIIFSVIGIIFYYLNVLKTDEQPWVNIIAYIIITFIISLMVSKKSKTIFHTIWKSTLLVYVLGIIYLIIMAIAGFTNGNYMMAKNIGELIFWLPIIAGFYAIALFIPTILIVYIAHLLLHSKN